MVAVDQEIETDVDAGWADQEIFEVRCGVDTAEAAEAIVEAQVWHVGDVLTFTFHKGVLGHIDVVRTCGQQPHRVSASWVLNAGLKVLLGWGHGTMQFRLDAFGILLHDRTEFSVLAEAAEPREAVRQRFVAAQGSCPGDVFAWGPRQIHRVIRVAEPHPARELLRRPPTDLAVRAVGS